MDDVSLADGEHLRGQCLVRKRAAATMLRRTSMLWAGLVVALMVSLLSLDFFAVKAVFRLSNRRA